MNINEGEVYKISDVKLAGTFVVPEAELRRYLLIAPGETFNRKLITSTQELMQNRLGVDGYAFAKVDPVPTPNNETNEVSLTFFIDPGNRVYVRNITFSGENSCRDTSASSACVTRSSGADRFSKLVTNEDSEPTTSISATSSVISASSLTRASSARRPARLAPASAILMLTSLSEQSTPAELSIKSVLIRPPWSANSIRPA